MRALMVLALVAGCGGSDDPPSFSPLTVDGDHLRDDVGRIVLLRGINARVEGVFDVELDGGRVPLEPIPALTAADCTRMRQLGLNTLRLPVNWSGIEPTRGSYDEAYLQRVDAAVACAGDAGLFVIVDMHQDAYSKEIGEDGAPLWAIVPPPDMLLEGPLDDLQERRLSNQVRRAFESFFAAGDPHGLQAAFIDVLRLLGARYADHPMVIGFEIFNEPDIGQDLLGPFHEDAAAALREAAPRKLVFFEPPPIRNFLDFQPLAGAPFPVPGAVYSPHIYTFIFGDQEARLQTLTKDDLRPSIDNARAEARAWGTPLFIGEFGTGPDTTNAEAWIDWQAELQDEYLASNAIWLWKEDSQGSWGVFDKVGDAWVERPQIVRWIARLQPHRIAGSAEQVRYAAAAATLSITSTGTGGAAHEIYVPAEGVPTVTCNGTEVRPPRDPATGVIEVPCEGVLVVGP
jgi:endoglycosylceramidase